MCAHDKIELMRQLRNVHIIDNLTEINIKKKQKVKCAFLRSALVVTSRPTHAKIVYAKEERLCRLTIFHLSEFVSMLFTSKRGKGGIPRGIYFILVDFLASVGLLQIDTGVNGYSFSLRTTLCSWIFCNSVFSFCIFEPSDQIK